MSGCTYFPRMRCCVWATLALMFISTAAAAQPVGEVESIGFNNVFRPACWTPMVVRIRPNGAPSATYQIQVKQRDSDNDTAIYTRNITLTGSEAGGRDQRFWMYFIPQPVAGGLPSSRDGASLKELQDLLEVYLCDESGKQISQLAVTGVPNCIDPPKSDSGARGVRLILAVNDGGSRISWSEYLDALTDRKALLGVLENVEFVSVRTRDLPESVLAYDAVDAVLWLDSNPGALRQDGGAREQALEAYIRNGGHLVISQSSNWQQTLAFGPLLPVNIERMIDVPDVSTFREMALVTGQGRRSEHTQRRAWDALAGKGPYRVAVATPRTNAVVDRWMAVPAAGNRPDEPPEMPPGAKTQESAATEPAQPTAGRIPFIVRQVIGTGAVTWVAQDLGDPAITSQVKSGWINVWDAVFGWQNEAIIGRTATRAELDRYAPTAGVDLGYELSQFEDTTQVGLFITLAVVFFVLYWLLAGPGLYLFLASRNRASASWFAYAAAAIVATLLTVVIVKLVLRGPPRLDHLTQVRGGRDGPGDVRSRFGVYIPRDGPQELALAQSGEPGTVSIIGPLPLHPSQLSSELETTGKLSYPVNVRDASSADSAAMIVPYRSTLKQFEARWQGEIEGRIEGVATISDQIAGNLQGRLTNGTTRELRDVYIGYKIPSGKLWMLYVPKWQPGETIDLQRERFGDRNVENGKPSARIPGIENAAPGGTMNLIGEIGVDWRDFWAADMRSLVQMGDIQWDDTAGRARRAWPMLTFFDALQPATADSPRGRIEFLRRGARQMNLTPALVAGGLVVVAEAVRVPQPGGTEVEGDLVPGNGRTIYQFVLPMERKVEE